MLYPCGDARTGWLSRALYFVGSSKFGLLGVVTGGLVSGRDGPWFEKVLSSQLD